MKHIYTKITLIQLHPNSFIVQDLGNHTYERRWHIAYKT